MWGADPTHDAPATVTTGGKTYIDAANTPGNAGDDAYINYGVIKMDSKKDTWAWFEYGGTWSKSNSGYSLPTGAVGFCTPGSSSSSEFYGKVNFNTNSKTTSITIYFTGTTEVGFIWKNNNTSNNRWIVYTLQELKASDGTNVGDPSVFDTHTSTAVQYNKFTSLDGTKYYKLVMSTAGASSSEFYGFTLKKYVAPATKYTVTYKSGDGTGDDVVDSDAKTVKDFADCSFTAPSGYEFKEWQDGSSNVVAAGATVSANMTLTAIYRLIPTKYTVTYSLNGASGDAPTETDKAAGDAFNLAAAPSWAGHAFDGWLCSADAGVKAAGSSYTMTAANTTFTAQWHELDCKIYSFTGGIGSAIKESSDKASVDADKLVLSGSAGVIKLVPAAGETFKAGDVITISGMVGNTAEVFGVKISASNAKGDDLGTASVAGTTIPLIASVALTGNADNLYISRKGGTTTTIYTCEVHRSCAEGTAAGLSYAEASVNKYTTDAAFTNPLTNTNGLVLAGYKSSNEEVATVNFSTGEVTIVGVGNATISVGSAVQTKAGTLYAAGTASYTLTVAAPQTFAVTYDNNGGDGTMTDPNSPYVEGAEVTLLANTFTAPSGKEFDEWVVTKTVGGEAVAVSEGKFTMPAAAVTVTATWKDATTKYEITKGTHANGDFTISPTEQAAGEIVTLTATPNEDYLFSAWEAYKTGDPTTTVTVTDNEFTMPAYAVTVNATFTADPRAKVLYLTTASTENDKVYEALKDDYNVTVAAPDAQTLTDYALVVLHESINGKAADPSDNTNKKQVILDIPTTTIPVLNTKSYFYTSARWNWGGAGNGKKTKGMHVNTDYCNITSHPLFTGLTPDVNDSIIILSSLNSDGKPIQPVTSFASGKAGYTLANVPDGCAIHELTPTQRGASSGKYLLISLYSKDFANLNANGQKLFQNAAAYLIGSTAWEPIAIPTSPEVTATPTAAYSVGDNIALTASATGTSAATTYTWYKGDDLATAKSAGAIKDAATAAAGGNTYEKATSVVGDAGTYWCVISNGTDCEASASLEITVSDASYNITFVSAHGSAPAATTGVSYTLPELSESGWEHQGWTASIDVTVDADPVTAGTTIANDKTALFAADVEFTAVWTQIFDVTFNMQDHGAAIDAQHILDGGKATKPAAPIAIGYDFGGWYKEAACTNAWDFANDVVTKDTELFAKWTAFTGCVEVYPAASGDALTVDATVALQSGSTGATIKVANLNGTNSIDYNAYGLSFSGGGKDSVRVTLNNDLQVGSVITVKLVSNGTTNSSGRGLNLFNAAHDKKALLGWQASEEVAKYDELSFSYTVTETDGFAGTNVIGLGRQNSVFLKSLKVSNCGAAITYHNLTSEVNIAGKGTVTLGATSVREGYTTTAEYSDIDPLYEFVNWTVSGAGASVADATANPATITMGTEDAVVTLNLQLIPVKFTVNYFDGTTPMGTEQVAVNEHPTASEIETAKRHYTFLGWSLTDGGDIVALNTITRTEATTVDLFAKYEAIPCPTSGTIFSMEFDETKKPGETVTIAKDASIDLAEYATISGGNAMIINGETSGKDAISTGGEFLLKATKEVMKIELNCVLQEGDIIRIPDNSAKLVISTSNAKTGTYQAFADKNTHEFAVTAAWAGVDDIYVLYDGSSLKFTKVYVIRPAKYTVSFNMMGHGSAISDLEDVLEGSKITAPTAPTDADYSFAGWYKENTLENEWNFDVDVVETNTTLYAKWLDKSDATLKSLKYGETEIALVAGVYVYNVSLPAFTSAVPALTAETSNPNATKVIANAAAFDSEGNATSTVTVTPEVGADQGYTVNFAKGVEILLQDVTGSITWNFANAVTGTVNITGTPQVLANYGGVTNDNTFESDKLEASGEKFTAGNKANLRANYIHFHTTVPGMLTISYSNTGDKPARYIYVNGAKYDEDGSANTTPKGADNKVFVPAGDVELVMKDGEGASKNVQIYQMIFNATPDYTRPVTEGRYGTICLPNGGVMTGASIYTLAYYGETSQKIFFDEVVDGTMEAGKPYLFLPNEGIDRIGVFYTDAANEPNKTVNGFVGYIGASEDPEDALQVPAGGGNYIVQNNQYREILTGATAYILSHRAYIHFAGINTSEPAKAPGARRIGISGAPQVVTGVDGLNVGDQPVKLIIDGQMYILRGDKMYDATGRLVK
jgi:uncharacterized repeat protein (TIGR02543 family)